MSHILLAWRLKVTVYVGLNLLSLPLGVSDPVLCAISTEETFLKSCPVVQDFWKTGLLDETCHRVVFKHTVGPTWLSHSKDDVSFEIWEPLWLAQTSSILHVKLHSRCATSWVGPKWARPALILLIILSDICFFFYCFANFFFQL